MTAILTSPPHIPVSINAQGGAGLGAYAAGMISALLKSESPRFHVISLGGTSSGGLTAASAAAGLAQGGRDKDGGNLRASTQIENLWKEHLVGYYSRNLHPFAQIVDAGHETCANLFLLRPYSQMMEMAFSLAGEMTTSRITPTQNYILDFLNDLEKRNQGIDFEAIRNGRPFSVNATAVPPGSDPYQAKLVQERIFTERNITKERLAASGTLYGLMSPICEKGELLYDGAYLTNPHLRGPVAICEQEGARLIVLRTRPANTYAPLNGVTPKTDEERRAFFNNMLDQQLCELKRDHPSVSLYVIEPSGIERQKRLWRPELSFHRDDVVQRFAEGFRQAQAAITEMEPPRWLRRRTARLSTPLRGTLVQAKTAAA